MRDKKSSLRRHLAMLQLFLLLLTGLQPAFAFKIPFHKQITEEVLRSSGFDEDSATAVSSANGNTDLQEASSDAAHADNNRLGAASERLRDKRRAIGDILNACQRQGALEAFGQALHTVQDIYSHSNSIDNGIPIPDLLGLSDGTAACSLPGFAPGGLVTGYFNLGGFFTGNQCRGIPATMCCHRDLNKDEPEAANGARHPAALDAARTATRTYLDLVEEDLRARFGETQAQQLLKRFKKAQRTTYFVIDDTGSMGNDIAGVKAAANAFLDQILAGDEAPTLGLVSFKDSVNDRGVTCDLEALRRQINALFASGGGDCPEASNSALLAALGHFPFLGSDMQLRGGRILLATDASAGDRLLGPLVAVQAALKGVSIDTILTGDCTSEEFAAPDFAAGAAGEEMETSENEPAAGLVASPDAATDAVDPLTSVSARTQLRALAEETGGVLFNVSRLEVDDVVPTLLELGEPDTAILISRKVELQAGVPFNLEVPVDDTLRDKVTFLVTASRSGILPAFTLRRPDGTTVAATDPGVAFRSLSSVRSYAITAPATGRWGVRLEGNGSFILRVFGGTPFRLNSVQLLTDELDLQRPEVDVVPLEGQPVVGDLLLADLRFTDTPTAAAASLRQLDGVPLGDLVLEPLDIPRWFRTALTVPAQTFTLEATGLTPGGTEFVRQASVPAVPQTVAVEATPELSVAAPGSTATIHVVVRNIAPAEAIFRLAVSSTLPWSVSGPDTVTVGPGSSTAADLTVSIPPTALEGQQSDLTIFAEDIAAPRVRNSATVAVLAGTVNRPPDCSAAQASPASVWPPNHALTAVGVLGVTDPDNDPVAITIETVTQDEPVLGTGSGDTAPDADGIGTGGARVRAERSGTGDGRVYRIGFRASDGKGGSCAGAVNVGVPHNQGKAPVDSGQAYDSTTQR